MRLFFCAFAVLFCSVLSAQSDKCLKTYIQDESVLIENGKIFVFVDDILLQPSCLQSDEEGIFFDSIKSDDRVPGPWQCQRPGCLQWNKEYQEFCRGCGAPRP